MAVTSVTEPHAPRLQRIPLALRRLGLALLVVFVVAAAVALGAVAFDRIYAERVLPGVSIAGVDASGLGADELRARLAELPVNPVALEIVSGGRRVTIPAGDLGRKIDVDGAVAAALAAGRVGGPVVDLPERLAMWREGRAVDLPVTVDATVLADWVAARAADLRVEARDAVIVPTATGWAATTPRVGKSLDVTAAVAAIEAALASSTADAAATAQTVRVEAPIITVAPEFDELDAALAVARAERMVKPLPISFRDGLSWTFSTETLRAAIRFEEGEDGPTAVVDPALLEPAIAPITKDVARPADETLILKSKSGKAFGFVPGRNGRSVDVAATAQAIADHVIARGLGTVPANAPVPIVLAVLPPELSAEEAADITREVTLVGAWTTRFSPSESNAFGANIRLPARFINGTVVQPGGVFDFWGTVGPVTFARGFGMGGIIEGGRTNPTGAIGGGICSASTTIFNAALRAGYQILERDQHAYYIPRYPLGLDATVSKYAGRISQNMRFRNDTNHPLLIRGLSGTNWVRFEIYSVPLGRTVTFTQPAVSNVRKAGDRTVPTSALKRGTSKRVEYPANGMDVVVYRTVRNSSGSVVHSDRFVSHYIRVDGILQIGTG